LLASLFLEVSVNISVLNCFVVTLKEYAMSDRERSDLSNFINKGGSTTNHSSVPQGVVAMMAVGGALILIYLLIGLVACIIARRSQRV